jgi:dTDP-4-dehydrorhamnose reductase
MELKIVVAGAAGRLGAAVCRELSDAGHHVTALTSADLDVRNQRDVSHVVGGIRPHALVNCAAYNAVDAAERDTAAAFALNAHAPAVLARAAADTGAVLVHYGSDFVFDGEAQQPYVETDPANPLSVYGTSKLYGEIETQRAPRHYVLRVESLFGGTGVRGHRATVDYIADTLLEGRPVKAVCDRTVTPSYVPDVARATRRLLERSARYGTYHCVNSGTTTWYELAQEIARLLGTAADIEPIQSADLQTAARRPRYCALSNEKLRAAGITMPGWPAAIACHVATRLEEQGVVA